MAVMGVRRRRRRRHPPLLLSHTTAMLASRPGSVLGHSPRRHGVVNVLAVDAPQLHPHNHRLPPACLTAMQALRIGLLAGQILRRNGAAHMAAIPVRRWRKLHQQPPCQYRRCQLCPTQVPPRLIAELDWQIGPMFGQTPGRRGVVHVLVAPGARRPHPPGSHLHSRPVLTIAMRVLLIGCMDGQSPRKHGVASTIGRDVPR